MSLLALDWHPITPLQSMQVVARQNPSKSRIHAHLTLILGRSSLQLEIRQGGEDPLCARLVSHSRDWV